VERFRWFLEWDGSRVSYCLVCAKAIDFFRFQSRHAGDTAAFDAMNLQHQLLSIPAGTWTHAVNSNANLVPTVANGKVFVASNQQVQIFGLFPAGRSKGEPTRIWHAVFNLRSPTRHLSPV